MTGKAGLKAGLIGVVVLLVITAINNLLPIAGTMIYVMCGVSMLIYAGVGVLAGLFLDPPRTPGTGAGAGAIAGLISGGINGVIGFIIISVRLAQGWGYPGLTPEQLQQVNEMGMNLQLLVIPGAICGLLIGSGVAAIGGAVLAAVKPD
jgi:hypothetical protein